MAFAIDAGVEIVAAWVGMCVVVLGSRRVRRLRVRRHLRRLAAAITEGDSARANALWEAFMRREPTWRQAPQVHYFEAAVLVVREDWHAALATCDELSNWKEGVFMVAVLRARCLAELGRGDEAMVVVDATRALPDVSPKVQAMLQATTGIVEVSRGDYLHALRTLEVVSPSKGVEVTCSFYRGEALRALGRFDEACAAYERTIALAPLSRRAAHARQRLALPPPSSYR